LTPNKAFSTKFAYDLLKNGIAGPNNKKLWKSKLPLKIKVFMLQVYHGAILTRENMRKKIGMVTLSVHFVGTLKLKIISFSLVALLKLCEESWEPVWD
jgi:hypothetical protein